MKYIIISLADDCSRRERGKVKELIKAADFGLIDKIVEIPEYERDQSISEALRQHAEV